MDTEYTCTHCGGDYVAPVNSGTTLCGECAEFSEFAELGRRVLNSNGGRGDTAAASTAMGYPEFRTDGSTDGNMTYHVYDLGGSIPILTLCGAHEALYRWDAVSAEAGVAHEYAAANYTTQGLPGTCDTCTEFAGGIVYRRPVSDAHCDTCTC